jgi:hypothetical protein
MDRAHITTSGVGTTRSGCESTSRNYGTGCGRVELDVRGCCLGLRMAHEVLHAPWVVTGFFVTIQVRARPVFRAGSSTKERSADAPCWYRFRYGGSGSGCRDARSLSGTPWKARPGGPTTSSIARTSYVPDHAITGRSGEAVIKR